MDNERRIELFAMMASDDIKQIFVEYSGSGDDGSMHEAWAEEGLRLDRALLRLAKKLAEEAVDLMHGSWEDGDGASGTVTFILHDEEIHGPRIIVDHREHITDTEVTNTTAWPPVEDETTVAVNGRDFTFKGVVRFGKQIQPAEIREAMAVLGIVSVDILYNTVDENLNFEEVSINLVRAGQSAETLKSFYNVPKLHGLGAAIYPLGSYLHDLFKMAICCNLNEQRGDSWWRDYPKDNGEASFVITNDNLAGHIRHDCYEYTKAAEKNFFFDCPAQAA